MSDLDDRLREILSGLPGDHAVYFEAYDEAIAQIKELFPDKESYRRGYNTGYIKARRNSESRKLEATADRLADLAQELYQAAHENEVEPFAAEATQERKEEL